LIHQTLKNKKNEGAKNAGLAKVNILYVENYTEYVPHGHEFSSAGTCNSQTTQSFGSQPTEVTLAL
jgi:hypothetical protein